MIRQIYQVRAAASLSLSSSLQLIKPNHIISNHINTSNIRNNSNNKAPIHHSKGRYNNQSQQRQQQQQQQQPHQNQYAKERYNKQSQSRQKKDQQQESTSSSSLVKILSNYEFFKFKSLEEEYAVRRRQAKQSVLVRYPLRSDLEGLIRDIELAKCTIKSVFTCEDSVVKVGDRRDAKSTQWVALIELASEADRESLLDNYVRMSDNIYVPARTRILSYRVFQNAGQSNQKLNKSSFQLENVNYIDETYTFDTTFDNVFRFFKAYSNSNEEIINFYKKFKIDEYGYRIRYFVASVIEDCLNHLFPNCTCLPFGSSSNRFGQRGADLDMTFSLYNRSDLMYPDGDGKISSSSKINNDYQEFSNGALFFYNKNLPRQGDDRKLSQMNLDLVEFVLRTMMPRFEISDVIKHARVPILKFKFQLKQRLDCDLSMSESPESYAQTKLLWTYAHMDERVAPLVFIVRYWANLLGLTVKVRPSPNLTNFQLTVLVLAYLIRGEETPVLPSIDEITRLTRIDNVLDDTDKINAVYIDLQQFIRDRQHQKRNDKPVSDLLIGFFDYYSKFDFENYSVGLTSELKTHRSKCTLSMENPIQPNLDSASNVNKRQLDNFVKFCKRSSMLTRSLSASKQHSKPSYRVSDMLSILIRDKKNAMLNDEFKDIVNEMNT